MPGAAVSSLFMRDFSLPNIAGCIVAGSFALLPTRLLGQLVWHQWLALV